MGCVHPVLEAVAHRPWPLPSGPWIMAQAWHDLLFVHWPVRPETLRRLVPCELALDTFDGNCWVGVAPFHMSGIRLRYLPAVPGFSRFPELNVRTYVTYGGKPGVYFFSLDAGHFAAVWAARTFYRLPYFHATMRVKIEKDWIAYHCRRHLSLENQSRGNQHHVEFQGRYRPISPVQFRKDGSLEHWLTERYCLYTTKSGYLYRAEIHHQQWPLQEAEAEIHANTMALASGISLPQVRPMLHFAKKLEVLIWPLRRVSISL
jgi:uncharacterized protein YqjF (DUF2071 family)